MEPSEEIRRIVHRWMIADRQPAFQSGPPA
jgi:hypothetical protein